MATTNTKPQVLAMPFCNSGNKNTIPTAATGTNLASLTEGFPVITSIPLPNGKPPKREDFNGIGNLLSQFSFAFQNGWFPTFDEDVSTAIGGYALGAILWCDSISGFVKSLKVNNTDNFVTDPSKIDNVSWQKITGGELHFPLFSFIWSDYLLNDQSWTRADTNSWQSGDVYTEAYNHLVQDNTNGTAATETVAGVTISYTLADDGHKIVSAANASSVDSIYANTGIAWYYVLDTENQQFKLPRTKWGFTGYRDTVGKYVAPGLPNITGNIYGNGDYVTGSLSASGAFSAGANVSRKDSAQQDTHSYPSINFSASNSNSIYGNATTVQPPATQMYLYFYVGNFSPSATEQTAGLNAELFNGKVDLNAANLSNAGKSLIAELGLPSTVYEDLTLGVSGTQYTAPSNGYVFLSAKTSVADGQIQLTAQGNYNVTNRSYNQYVISILLPISKGKIFTPYYDGTLSNVEFRFIYSEGSKQEAQ